MRSMSRVLLMMVALIGLASGGACAEMTLRDAIYLYGKDVRSSMPLHLVGLNCDVFQLVLDVESGYADIDIVDGATSFAYPDRILDFHEMFAYALYSSSYSKRFSLGDKSRTLPDVSIGRSTAFGYCYATNASAYVYLQDTLSGQCTNSRGVAISCP